MESRPKHVKNVFTSVKCKTSPSDIAPPKWVERAAKRGRVVADDDESSDVVQGAKRKTVALGENEVAQLVEYRDDRFGGKAVHYAFPVVTKMERYASCFFTDVAVNLHGHVGVLFPLAVGVRTENRRSYVLDVKRVSGRVVLGHTDEKVPQEQEMYAWLVYDKRTDGTLPAYADIFEGTLPCMAGLRPRSEERYVVLASGQDRMKYDLRVGAPSKEFGAVRLDYADKSGRVRLKYSGDSNRYEDMASALYVVTVVQSWDVQQNHPETTGNETSCYFDMYYEE